MGCYKTTLCFMRGHTPEEEVLKVKADLQCFRVSKLLPITPTWE